jgi:hypothetical protein
VGPVSSVRNAPQQQSDPMVFNGTTALIIQHPYHHGHCGWLLREAEAVAAENDQQVDYDLAHVANTSAAPISHNSLKVNCLSIFKSFQFYDLQPDVIKKTSVLLSQLATNFAISLIEALPRWPQDNKNLINDNKQRRTPSLLQQRNRL